MTAISDLVSLRDPEGILTLCVDAGAERERRHRPRTGEVALHEGLQRVRAGLREAGPRDRERLLEARLEEIGPALQDLVDPALPGRGRVLAVPLSGGPSYGLETAWAVEDCVVLAPTAHASPLLHALAGAHDAGAVSLGADDVRLVALRPDGADEVLRIPYGIPSEDWRPMVGPAGANPQHAPHSESQRDLFATRLEEHRDAAIRGIAPRIWDESSRRGWDHVVVTGAGERVRALLDTRAPEGPAVLVPEVQLSDETTPEEVRATVAEPLADARARAGVELTTQLRDRALTPTGRAVVGLDDTLTALSEGQVHRLVLDAAARHAGARAPDGRLVASGEVPPGADPAELTPEPHLVERMIERALATDATVTAVEGPAAEPLAPFGGVAAELRW
jgi:hypothetical protein